MRYVAPMVIAVLAVLVGAVLYVLRYEEIELGKEPSIVIPTDSTSFDKSAKSSYSAEHIDVTEAIPPLVTNAQKHVGASQPRFASENEEVRHYISEVLALRVPDDVSLDDTLTALHKDEPRNESWAGPLEAGIHEAVEGIKDITIRKLDCRTSLCRLDMELTDPKDRVPFMQHKDFIRAFMRAKGKNVVTYGRLNLFSTQWTGFLLNLEQPEPFIEKFRSYVEKFQQPQSGIQGQR